MTDAERFLERALALAERGRGRVSPNPMVGAVLVKDGRIIGEGYHEEVGGPHAEVRAIRSAEDSPEGATLYVTLEPCSHVGKTPPCTEACIEAGVVRVVTCMKDPNPRVGGEGMLRLREAGIEVEVGLLCEASARLNEKYHKYITTGAPFVLLKAAVTLDGKTATAEGYSQWITSKAAREYAHQIRYEYDAVAVGINTVLIDDPRLTVRLPDREKPRLKRVVFDSHLRIPIDAQLFREDGDIVVFTTATADEEKQNFLRHRGVAVEPVPTRAGRVDVREALRRLGEMEVTSLLLEGGAEISAGFLEDGLVDKICLFVAPKILGGRGAIPLIGGDGFSLDSCVSVDELTTTSIGEELLIEGYLRRRSHVHRSR